MKRSIVLRIVCLFVLLFVGCNIEQADTVTLHQPPELKVTVGDRTVNPTCISPQWTVWDEDGNVIDGYITESGHTLQSYELGKPELVTEETEVFLNFAVEPDWISVTCWKENAIHQEYPVSEKCILKDHTLELHPGSYIYEIKAKWERALYEGTANYSFYIKTQ